MSLHVGALLVSRKTRRRARVTGLTTTMVRIEFSDRGWQWRLKEEIEALYRVV